MKFSSAVTILSLCLGVSGHGGVWRYSIDNNTYEGYKWWKDNAMNQTTIQRRWPSRYPLEDDTHPFLACNDDGAPTNHSQYARIEAGSTISSFYNKNFPITGENEASPLENWGHEWGPMIAYIATCNGPCESFNFRHTPVWFKIDEVGLLNGTFVDGTWGMTALYNGQPWTLRIPESLRPGRYLIRHELITVHQPPNQHYPECAQLEVTGSGDKLPGSEYLVSFPGAYSPDDPGQSINHFFTTDSNRTEYVIPGPRLWTG